MTTPMWTDIIQTVGIVAALLFTGFEILARTREQKFRNYLDMISGFIDLAKLMIEKNDLHGLYDYSNQDIHKSYRELSPEQKARVHYCDTLIALCETVWVASKGDRLPKDEWQYWQRWTNQLHKSAEFRWTLDWVKDDYDPAFLATLVKTEADIRGRMTIGGSVRIPIKSATQSGHSGHPRSVATLAV